MSTDTKRTIAITKKGDRLYAKFSEQQTFPIVFQSDSKFQFENLLGAECEFVKENGKITKMNVQQNGLFVWIKTK